jgi:hypothetical protein
MGTMRRHATATLVALALPLVLVACTPDTVPPSSITVDYELDGEMHTVTMHPEGVDCSDAVIGASAALERPVGIFTFGRAIGDGDDRLSGGVQVDDATLYVESDAVALPDLVDGELDLPATDVTGRLADDAQDDGIPVTGTLTAHLVCDAAE